MTKEYFANLRSMEARKSIHKLGLLDIKIDNILEIGPGENPLFSLIGFDEKNYIGLEKDKDLLNGNIVYNEKDIVNNLVKKYTLIYSSSSLYYIENPIDALISFDTDKVKAQIHIIPSSTWRIWTMLAAYLAYIRNKKSFMEKGKKTSRSILDYFILKKHSSRGNRVNEFYYYSTFFWKKNFKFLTEYSSIHVFKSRVFYTGFNLFGEQISFETRKLLSYILGSSSKIYILIK